MQSEVNTNHLKYAQAIKPKTTATYPTNVQAGSTTLIINQ